MKRSTRLLSMLHFLPSGVFLHLAYLNETGHVLYLKNPRRFNEKLNFIKLRGGAEGWSRFVDKLEVREHVRRMVGETHLVPLIAQYDSVGEIDWTALPERFVIKCSHGSHCGLICTDKTNFDTAYAEARLRTWMHRYWYWVGRETPYKAIRPRIMVEQFIGEDHPAQDYKLMCFGGLPHIIQVHTKRNGSTAIDFFDSSGRKLAMRKKGYPNSPLERIEPNSLSALLPVAEKLAAGFPYVRVDLYLHQGRVFFGEMTFFDSAALREFEPDAVNIRLGDMIALPNRTPRSAIDRQTDGPNGGDPHRQCSGHAPRHPENRIPV